MSKTQQKTKPKSPRELKKERIQNLQKKKSVITNIKDDIKKNKNALIDKVADIDQQLNNFRKIASTKFNKMDSFQDSLDGALQDIDIKTNILMQALHNTNEKVDSILEILSEMFEEETDDETSDNKSED